MAIVAHVRPPPSEGGSCWILAREVVVRYPFHPLTGQVSAIFGEHEHYGSGACVGPRGLTDDHSLPVWMTLPKRPRREFEQFAVAGELFVRAALGLDKRIMVALSSGEIAATGGLAMKNWSPRNPTCSSHCRRRRNGLHFSARKALALIECASGGSKARTPSGKKGHYTSRGRS